MIRVHWTDEEFWEMFAPICHLAKDLNEGGEEEISEAMIGDAIKVWLIFTPVAGYA